MPIPVLYGAAITLPPVVLLTLGTRTEDVTPTLATGDVQINKDNGGWVNITALPTTGNSPVNVALSAAEATCKVAIIRFKDQTSPAEWDQRFIDIYTYGHASALDVRLVGTDGKSVISTDAQDLSATLSVNMKAITAGIITNAALGNDLSIKPNRSATAAAGAAQSITLDSGASATEDFYTYSTIKITSGLGAGQARTIVYYSTGKIAYVDRPWKTNPDSSSVFTIDFFTGIPLYLTAGIVQTATASTIQLAVKESSVDGRYNGLLVRIKGGTGIGQLRTIVAYTGSTTTATISRPWDTTPDSTSIYSIEAIDNGLFVSIINAGTAQTGAAGSITLATSAIATANYYDGSVVYITGGTGIGQARIISSYAASRVATVSENWSITPDNTSTYIIKPLGEVNIGAILGTAISTPATAGILDVNVKNMNNVAATAVTTVNANQGTTQPINFTGTGASALTKADLIDIVGAAVNATLLANLRTMVWDELLSVSRTALTYGAKIKNWLIGTDNKILLSTDSQAGVTIPTVTTVTNRVTANSDQIASSASAATNLASSANTISNGTVDNTAFTATTTELEASNITDAEPNLYKGRSIMFMTGHLAKEYANITAYSLVGGRGHFTYSALSSAPSNADTFEVF